MRTFRKPFILIVVLALCLLGITCDTSSRENVQSRDLAVAVPEDMGMSSERLSRVSSAMQELVDDGKKGLKRDVPLLFESNFPL